MTRRNRWLLVAMVTVTALLSLSRWWMEAVPARHWRGQEPTVNRLFYCPDGMGEQIQRFALVLRGEEGAWTDWMDWIQNTHQSSTWLVSILAAPFVLLGTDGAWAFVLVSILASLGLVALLWRLLRSTLGLEGTDALLLLAVFLVHPATVRCFARPQTDALLAFFALASVMLGLGAARRPGWANLALLALAGSAACFVKIHALSLLLVPPAAAWLAGARGGPLVRVVVAGTLVPLALWWSLFAAGDLFPTIRIAWDYKEQFYGDWTLTSVLLLLVLTVLPLAVLVPWGEARHRATRQALLLLVAGFAAILVLCSLPPLVRFQYPALAALIGLAARSGVGAATGGGGLGTTRRRVLVAVGCWCLLCSGGVVGLLAYGRFLGPTRDFAPLDQLWILVM